MRNPALQFQNRMRKLADVLFRRTACLMATEGKIKEKRKELDGLEATRNRQILELKEAEALQSQLIQSTYSNGLFPWGLPPKITIKQWIDITEEMWEGQSQDMNQEIV